MNSLYLICEIDAMSLQENAGGSMQHLRIDLGALWDFLKHMLSKNNLGQCPIFYVSVRLN